MSAGMTAGMNAGMDEPGRRINTMDLNLRNAKLFRSEDGNFLGEICGVVENYENNRCDIFHVPPCEFRRLGLPINEALFFAVINNETYHRLLVMGDNGDTLADQFRNAYTGDDFTIEEARAELAVVCTEASHKEFAFIDGSVLTLA